MLHQLPSLRQKPQHPPSQTEGGAPASLYVRVPYNSGILSPMDARKNEEQLNSRATRPRMREYPLTVDQIVSWYHSKQRSLEGSGISLVNIQGRDTGPKPAAFADFDGANTLGRIDGWVSGEFDFHALRSSDGKDIFWRHLDVSSVAELEAAYTDFLLTLQNPETREQTR